MQQLLVEKYRPDKIEDIVGLDKSLINLDKLPHLLLYGPPGTGKTTLARAIIKTLNVDHMVLNASDERGIDTVRDKVKTFASSQGISGLKIVFLDEADALTQDAQTALRNTMERYSDTCRFILTANYPNKIIDPLKSRCQCISFGIASQTEIVERLKYICENEQIPHTIEALKKIVELSGSDIRKAINKIQELREVGITLNNIHNNTTIAESVFSAIVKSDFGSCRQIYLDSHQEPEQFIKDLHDVIWNSSEDMDYKKQAILDIVDYYKFIAQVAFKDILVEAMLLRLIENRI